MFSRPSGSAVQDIPRDGHTRSLRCDTTCLVPSPSGPRKSGRWPNAILTKALGASTGKGLDKYQLGLTKIFFRRRHACIPGKPED